jgi:hypothetical protein
LPETADLSSRLTHNLLVLSTIPSFGLNVREPYKGLLLISMSRTRKNMAVEGPEGTEHLNEVYMLAPKAFRAKVRGTKYREANDPETEIWRACQRSGTAVAGG